MGSVRTKSVRDILSILGSLPVIMMALVFFISVISLHAQDRYMVKKPESNIIFDGLCNEEAWENIEPFDLIMFSPDYGSEPSEKTEIRIAYDETYLYFSGVFHDSNPEKMKIQLKRDDWKYECDWFIVILDTYSDKENTVVFATSPSGGRTDVSFAKDVEVLMRDMNTNWNTYWDVKTNINDNGWEAEMRIPFSSLRFNETDEGVVMGLGLIRGLSYRNEVYSLPTAKREHTFWGIYKASQTREILIKGISPRKPVYITPYILGGLKQQNILNDEGTAYEHTNKPEWNIGLDTKMRVADNLTLDLSLNTDFAQVEDDNQRVNLTRFPLFFEEKRQFFQERRTNFEFNFNNYNRLFHTREIGLYGGQPVTVYGGARLVGRIKSWDLGLLSMQTAPFEDELLSENFTVMRMQRDVINEQSTAGAIFASRTDLDGNYNVSYGLDASVHLFGNEYLKAMWAQTFETGEENQALSLDPARIFFQWERRTSEGLAYNFNFNMAGPDYNPGIGFESRTDYSRYGTRISYDWINSDSWLYTHGFYLSGYLYSDNTNKITETSSLVFGWSFESRDGMSGRLSANHSYENLVYDFNPYPDLSVPQGKYNFLFLDGYLYSPRGRAFVLQSSFSAGQWYDGYSGSITLTPSVIIKQRLQFTGTYSYSRAWVDERGQDFNSHLFSLRGQLVLNTKLSLSAFIQYSSVSKFIPSNIRLRYNPREGNDLYIIYDEGFNTDRYREIPVMPVSRIRTIMLKYTYTFIL